MKPALTVFPKEYSILRLNPEDSLPGWICQQEFISITRTPFELSIVTDQDENIPADIKTSKGWRMIMINGPLDFGLVGIIAGIASILKNNNIPLFVISTFDTDYFLVNAEHLNAAIAALEKEEYRVQG